MTKKVENELQLNSITLSERSRLLISYEALHSKQGMLYKLFLITAVLLNVELNPNVDIFQMKFLSLPPFYKEGKRVKLHLSNGSRVVLIGIQQNIFGGPLGLVSLSELKCSAAEMCLRATFKFYICTLTEFTHHCSYQVRVHQPISRPSMKKMRCAEVPPGRELTHIEELWINYVILTISSISVQSDVITGCKFITLVYYEISGHFIISVVCHFKCSFLFFFFFKSLLDINEMNKIL